MICVPSRQLLRVPPHSFEPVPFTDCSWRRVSSREKHHRCSASYKYSGNRALRTNPHQPAGPIPNITSDSLVHYYYNSKRRIGNMVHMSSFTQNCILWLAFLMPLSAIFWPELESEQIICTGCALETKLLPLDSDDVVAATS